MSEGDQSRWNELFALHLVGDIGDDELAELEWVLKGAPEARALYHRACRIDTRLRREAAGGASAEPVPAPVRAGRGSRSFAWLAAAASITLLVGVLSRNWWTRPDIIATIVSAEDAAWRSTLPTEAGSELTAGDLELASGLAMIRFKSGAELTLEGPASVTLISPMRVRLASGAALVEVPESAHGFILETPDGFAVDYGTKFAVRVDGPGHESRFELIEGEIAVHHPKSGQEVRLNDHGKTATISEEALAVLDPAAADRAPDSPRVIRIHTRRKTASVRQDGMKKPLDRDVLSVKRTNSGKRDHYSFFSINLAETQIAGMASAQLRLNLVPSSRGYAARLPKINRFAVYGIAGEPEIDWKIGCSWEEAPTAEEGTLLGSFEIRRSQQRGSFGIGNGELLEFLQTNAGQQVTFILVRETTQIEGFGPGLTHTFASASHPEAVGPCLEFTIFD